MASGCRRQKICAIRVICVTRNFAAEHKKNPRRGRNALPWIRCTQKSGQRITPPTIELTINDLQRFTITFALSRSRKGTEKSGTPPLTDEKKNARSGRTSHSPQARGSARDALHESRKPRQLVLSGFPLWVGGGLLSHAVAQYHRRCGA